MADRSTLDQQSTTPAAADIPWMMLDRFVFDAATLQPDGLLTCTSTTSLGESFSVELCPTAPPAVSRLSAQYGEPDNKVMEVVTADRGLFLLRLTTLRVPGPDPYRQDYLVFRPASPSLIRRLPQCTEPIVVPSRSWDWDGETTTTTTMKRWFHNNTLGLVSYVSSDDREDELGFAVVQLAKFDGVPLCALNMGARKMGAEVCVFRSSNSRMITDCQPGTDHPASVEDTGEWEILTLPIRHTEEEFSDLLGWSTDGAVVLGDTICWFDYHHGGMLFYRPSLGEGQGGEGFIRYARLPINNRPTNSLPSQKKLATYRSLCVTGGEMLRYVDVARDDGTFYGPLSDGYTFTITCHAFNPTGLTWEVCARTTSDELCRRDAPKLMPRNTVPTFPLVSRTEPHLIHFLMAEPREGIDKLSVVTVDILAQTIVSVTPYIQGDEDLSGRDEKMVRLRSRQPWSFLPFQF